VFGVSVGIMDNAGAAAGPIGDYDSIATLTASSGATVLSFTSIPSTYKHLQIRLSAGNSAGQNYTVRFNNDSGGNYVSHRLSGTGTTVSSGVTGPSSTSISVASNAGLLPNSLSILDILDYTNTSKNKTTRSISGWDNNSSGYIDFESGLWFATPVAITRIDLFQAWATGSTASLYGIKG
jgi:hypothetical protein